MKRLLAFFLFGLLGCDLGDYQRRMDESRVRLKILDEENRHLGLPLARPQTLDKEGKVQQAWPGDVYLRLPRKVSANPSAEEAVLIHDVATYKYPGEGNSVFVAVANIGVEKTKEPGRPPTAEEFRKRAIQGLHSHVGNEKDFFGNMQCNEKTTPRTIDVPAAIAGKDRKLTLETFQCEATATVKSEKERDTMLYSGFHYQAADVQVIVVYQYPKGKEELVKGIDLSIRSLALEPEAALRRRDFNKTHPKR